MTLRFVEFPTAGSGGTVVYINPEQIVCLIDMGKKRTQIVTTGLSNETSMSLIVELKIQDAMNLILANTW